MEKILLVRQKLREFYARYNVYIDVVLKFGFVLLTLFIINDKFGYQALLTKWNVVLIIALVASLFTWPGITCVIVGFLLVHLYALSLEAAILTAGIVFIAAVLHYLFLPGFSIVIVLIPLAFYLRIPYVIPVVVGLVGRSTSFIPVGIGTFGYYLLLGLEKNAPFLSEGTNQVMDIIERFTTLLGIIFDNRLMWVSVLAVCLTTLAVYAVRRLSMDYGPYIAALAGIVVNAAVFVIFGLSFEVTISYSDLFLEIGLSLIPVVLLTFFILAVDYSRTEFLQYEDDDYLYYVKAVPKVKLTARERRKHEIQEEQVPEPEDDIEIDEAIKILDEMTEEELKQANKGEEQS